MEVHTRHSMLQRAPGRSHVQVLPVCVWRGQGFRQAGFPVGTHPGWGGKEEQGGSTLGRERKYSDHWLAGVGEREELI